ncbi:hypothetical protein C9374_009906 [Naegleria lovaniensis]|uniref:Antistasin-like domain-containing protein n=1 Tax=Naegleria lovaniensis TaxID=51637 RepID=A0AA88GI24_NAELO|nr:uncharacterized protein C9374_009906 [Naegleria lovaniensis]KAG2375283.1 hypothetical protein C9374_009906 [Naegleria lovaniensis]
MSQQGISRRMGTITLFISCMAFLVMMLLMHTPHVHASFIDSVVNEAFDIESDVVSSVKGKICTVKLCDLKCPHGLDTDEEGCPVNRCARLVGPAPYISNGVSMLPNIAAVCRYVEVCRMHCPHGFLSYKGCPLCKCYNPPKVVPPKVPVPKPHVPPVRPPDYFCPNKCECGFKPGHGFKKGYCGCIPFQTPVVRGVYCAPPRCRVSSCPFGLARTLRNTKCPTCGACDRTPIRVDYEAEIKVIREQAKEKAAKDQAAKEQAEKEAEEQRQRELEEQGQQEIIDDQGNPVVVDVVDDQQGQTPQP